jgi:predicted unusual protein kinase regulating ubiquinone biosynthesis (AarF/ABC1/UbiB family)
MKAAQLLATIPEALPAEYTAELAKLQSQAPPMGWAFVKRRMQAELGADWQDKFASRASSVGAASLGQVHRAHSHDGAELACKLQYPDMQSAVEADLRQLAFCSRSGAASIPRSTPPKFCRKSRAHARGTRLSPRGQARRALYRDMLKERDDIRVPASGPSFRPGGCSRSTGSTAPACWSTRTRALAVRNRLATAMFTAWWLPFIRLGVIHGDPHLGNYTVFEEKGRPAGINLLDYGCIRIFPPKFVGGVVDLYNGLRMATTRRVCTPTRPGASGLSRELIDILNIWARFIYGPLMDDRVRTIADGVKPGEYGRRQAFEVHQALREKGPVTVPREFVLMDRAAIGLGGVFIHLKAELNFYQLFNEALEDYALDRVADRQSAALTAASFEVRVVHRQPLLVGMPRIVVVRHQRNGLRGRLGNLQKEAVARLIDAQMTDRDHEAVPADGKETAGGHHCVIAPVFRSEHEVADLADDLVVRTANFGADDLVGPQSRHQFIDADKRFGARVAASPFRLAPPRWTYGSLAAV